MPMLIPYLQNQQKNEFSPVVLVVGRQRMGKTTTALTLGYEMEGDEFDPRGQLVNSVKEFGHAWKRYNNKVIVYDEVGQELDPFRAMNNLNRVFSHIVQTQAYKRNVLFVILPHATDVVKGHRKYVNAVVHIVGRGSYKLYAVYSWHADMNDSKLRMTLIEHVTKVPLPPKHILSYYKNEREKDMKDKILDRELASLEPKPPKTLGRPLEKPKLEIPKPRVVQI